MLENSSSLGDPAYSLAILNRFQIATNHDLPMGTAGQGVFDEFSSDTLGTATGLTYNSEADKYFNVAQYSTTTFGYTGSAATYTIPANVSSVTFKAWGAAGGGGNSIEIGGGGGFTEETLTVTPGENLNVKIGGGGTRNWSGNGHGGGGGWTSIERSGTPLAGAGGGGGASANGYAGSGGGVNGLSTNGGGGGTQTAGGASGGTGGNSGSSLQGGSVNMGSGGVSSAGGYNGGGSGGNSPSPFFLGGGGGGGYFGGGSGPGVGSGANANGGGGSGYAPTGTTTAGGSNGNVANSSDIDYPGGVGNGIAVLTGQHGYAVIKYAIPLVDTVAESVSTTITADPTSLRFDFIITETDALTLGTDITVKGTRDGGVTYTAATLTKVGTLPTGESHIKAEVDVSGQPSGTAMRYKLESFNEKSYEIKFVYQLPIY